MSPCDLSHSLLDVCVPVWVVPGTVTFPLQCDSAVVMIGPGTGCAPFRAYLEERVAQHAPGTHTFRTRVPLEWHIICFHPYIANMMFFGCRSECADFFFASEWELASQAGCLILHTAFSRDQPHKVYVQHKLEEEGEEVWRWISQRKAHIFIAG